MTCRDIQNNNFTTASHIRSSFSFTLSVLLHLTIRIHFPHKIYNSAPLNCSLEDFGCCQNQSAGSRLVKSYLMATYLIENGRRQQALRATFSHQGCAVLSGYNFYSIKNRRPSSKRRQFMTKLCKRSNLHVTITSGQTRRDFARSLSNITLQPADRDALKHQIQNKERERRNKATGHHPQEFWRCDKTLA